MMAGHCIDRRQFLQKATSLGLGSAGLALLAACGAASASKDRIWRVGDYGATPEQLAVIRDALRNLGYDDKRLELIELSSLFEAGRLKPDVLTVLGAPSVRTARTTNPDTPIVSWMPLVSDPVAEGFAQSLNHPGGNLTGLIGLSLDLWGKRLDLLKATLPNSSRVGVLLRGGMLPTFYNAPAVGGLWQGLPDAKALGLELVPCAFASDSNLNQAFDAATASRADAIAYEASFANTTDVGAVASLALKYRLPVISGALPFAAAGGLMAYAADGNDVAPRLAVMVDRILRGEKAGDIPMERPTRFALSLNMKTAQALGVTFPEPVLLQATEVIR
jgi:ABC-type uncharacterized transport system substrate-binding protein